VTVTFSYGAAPQDIQNAIKLINSKKVKVTGMITNRIQLSDIKKGFQLASKSNKSLKVIVIPDREM
jgi:L-iditol 2-dehydrogenase